MHLAKAPVFIIALLTVAGTALAAGSDPEGAVGLPDGVPDGDQCNVIGVCPTGTLNNGDAFAGGGLVWQTNFTDQRLELVDTNNNCTILASCPAPGATFPSENTFDGTYLYHYDFGTGLIYQIDTANCEVLSACDPPGDDLAEGLTYDGEFFWKGDSQNIYKFAYTPNGCQVVSSCPNPAGDSADGLSICGDFVIMLGYSGRVYQLDPDTCAEVASCQLNVGAAGNGAASDRISTLWMGSPTNSIDVLEEDCSVPVPVDESTWGTVKGTFRD